MGKSASEIVIGSVVGNKGDNLGTGGISLDIRGICLWETIIVISGGVVGDTR
jgi:hypothetical protein